MYLTIQLFFPILAWVGIAVGSAIAGFIVTSIFSKKINKLGILGMKLSGKTTMLYKLQGIEKIPQSTNVEKYERFEFKIKDDKKIIIEKGKDIGGTKNFMQEYRDIISNNEIIFFFFDVNKYLIELDYRRDCNSRLDFIYPSISGKKVVIVATHADKQNLKNQQIREKIEDYMKEKKYSSLFTTNFHILNLLDTNEFKVFIEKIFS